MRSDQRIAIYWPKNDLLVFIIIVKTGVVPTKNGLKCHESDKAIQKKKKEKKKGD